jgi:hypothetical protein
LTVVILAALAAGLPQIAAAARWSPGPGTTWQVQFSGRLDVSVDAAAFDVDMFDTAESTVAALHADGRHVVCYIDAGSWENWRPDAARYPRSVKGRALDGWPGERWLDIRRIDLIGPILTDRLDQCQTKGFDGVEFDNVDGYSNRTGFALTSDDQLTFDRWLAARAHERGLAVGLKNTLDLADQLEPDFDFAILEQCFEYRECASVAPFTADHKSVVDIEYSLAGASSAARRRIWGSPRCASGSAWTRGAAPARPERDAGHVARPAWGRGPLLNFGLRRRGSP